MNCQIVQHSLSNHLDGYLPAAVRQGVVLHLAGCPQCSAAAEQLARVRKRLRELPVETPPRDLVVSLQVLASRERLRRLAHRSPSALLAHWAGGFRLWLDNLMRPLALPFAGGVVSAVVLFSILVPFLPARRAIPNDVPTAIYTEATVKSMAPFGFAEDDLVLEINIDENGRMIDYSVASGPGLEKNPSLRRAIESNLLFTRFAPTTYFGYPEKSSKILVSFSRAQINIGS